MSSSFTSPSSSPVSPAAVPPAARAAAPSVRRPAATALLCLVAAGLLWGTGGLTGTLLGRVAGSSPLFVAALRLLAGGGLIIVFRVAPRRRWPVGRAAWTRVTVTGLLAATFQAAYFSAVSLTSVSLATLITIGGAPVIVTVTEAVLGRRRLSRSSLATTALALAGLGLLIGMPGGGYSPAAMLAGAGLALLASGGFATLTLISSSPVPGLDVETVTGIGFAAGGLVLLPLATVLGGLAFRPSVAAIGLLAALGAGPTALAYTLYFRGLRAAPASTGALLSLLEPLTATVLGVILLGNRLSPADLAGALLLGAAIAADVAATRRPGE
jgi:DME family drug/metabolite transporter